MLVDKDRFVVNWVAGRLYRVVHDLERGRRTKAERITVARVRQLEGKGFRTFNVRVVID